MGTLEDAIIDYCDRGWSLMLLDPGQKKTTTPDWPNGPDDVDWLLGEAGTLPGAHNLAVRLGERSGQLADVDLDTDASRAVAPHLLPKTAARFGRDGVRGDTHYLYLAPDGPPKGQRGTMRLNTAATPGDTTVTTYAELRWNGAYTVLPPSTHPEGGGYRWSQGGSPPAAAWSTLAEATREVAAAALLVEAYPELKRLRHRHYTSLALSAALLRAGWPLPRVEKFVYACAQAAGDEEADARVDNARSTAERLAAGEHLGGWSALVSYLGDGTVTRFQRFLGLDPRATSAGAWAGVVSPPGPPVGPTAPASPAAQAPAQPAKAPVIQTAQQAQAAQQGQGRLSVNEVAFMVASNVTKRTPTAKDEGQGLYLYRLGVYVEDPGEMRLRVLIQDEVVQRYGMEFLSPDLVADVLYHIRVNVPPIETRPDPRWLNLANGRLELATLQLHPHDPGVRTTVKLPVAYDPTAGCPKIEAFCAQVFPTDAVQEGVPWEVVALCLYCSKGIDKAILLLGDGENGKGIFLDLMRAFVGVDNTSAVALQRLGDNRFATSDLRGKLLNVSMDLPSKRLEDSGDFKAIVSGEVIRAERKNQPAFVFEPFCRLLYSANHLPESDDTSRGYQRRWHILPFDVTFDIANPNRRPRNEIFNELSTDAELSGLLNRVLPALVAFVAGAQPRSTSSMDEAIEEFRDMMDPFPLWVRGVLQHDPQGWVETAALVQRYRDRVERRGRTVLLTGKQVARALKDQFPHVTEERKRVGGTGHGIGQAQGQQTSVGAKRRGWRGVSWRLGMNP